MTTRAFIVACVAALLALCCLSAPLFASASPVVAPFSTVLLNQCPSPLYTSLDSASGNYYLACSSGVLMYNPTSQVVSSIATASVCPTPTAVLRDATSNTVLAACSTAGLLRFNADGSSSVLISVPAGRKVTSVSVDGAIAQLYYYTSDSDYNGPVLNTVGSINLAAGSAPVITQLANSTQCGKAFQAHGINGVIAVSCSNYGSTSPVVYVPTVVLITNGVVRTLITSASCYYPQGIMLYPNGQVLVGCSTSYSNFLGSLSVLAINSTSGSALTVLAQRDCDQGTAFSLDSATGIAYLSCTGFAGGLWAINSISPLSVTRLVDQNMCWNGRHVLALSGANTQVLSCQYQDVLKVINGAAVSFITNQCPTSLSLNFDARSGTLDALCSSYAVASVNSTGSSNTVTFPRTCYPMRVLRDTTDGMTAYVSCGEGGAKILSFPNSGGMSTRSAGSMTGSCSMAMVQPSLAGSQLFVSCAASIYATNGTVGGLPKQFVAGSISGCPQIVDMVIDASGAINAVCFYNTYNLMAQYSSNGSVTATLPYNLWLSGCAGENILSPVLDSVTGKIVAVCGSRVVNIALSPVPSINLLAAAGCTPMKVTAANNTAYYTCTTGVWAAKLGGVAPVQLLSLVDCTNPTQITIDAAGQRVFVGCAQGVIGVDVSALVFPTSVPASSSTGSGFSSSTGSVNTGGGSTTAAGTVSSSSSGANPTPLPNPAGSNGTASTVQSASAAACLATLVTILAIAA